MDVLVGVDGLAAPSPNICRVYGGGLPKPGGEDLDEACWAGIVERETAPEAIT